MRKGTLVAIDVESLVKVTGGADECAQAGEAWIRAGVEQVESIAARVRNGPRDPALIKAEKDANGRRTTAWRAYETCLNGGHPPDAK